MESLTIQADQPLSTADGALWYDSQANCLKVYVQGGWCNATVDEDYEMLNNKEW